MPKIGKLGEDLAFNYLISKKYKVFARNYKIGWDELDIIAFDPEGTLVFLEIKSLKKVAEYGVSERLMPEDNATRSKLHKLKRAANRFTGRYPHLIKEEHGWRVDLIAIVLSGNSISTLRHYKNI